MKNEGFPAHLSGYGKVQTVEEHLRATAQYAGEALADAGLRSAGKFAGMVHDAGKYTDAFRDYINGQGVKGSVIHSFTGVRMILKDFHNGDAYSRMASELMAYAVGAHHGAFDCINQDSESGFSHRMTKEGIGYEEALSNYHSLCMSAADLQEMYRKAGKEVTGKIKDVLSLSQKDRSGEEFFFMIGLLARMILSGLIEGDRKDTAQFMSGHVEETKTATPDVWEECLQRVEEKLRALPKDTEIQKARANISDQCREAAQSAPGVYRLKGPTGCGKTLASLRYALAHAARYGKRRIIFTTPLLSILEQNAAVLRDYIGDDNLILEHHSNVVHENESMSEINRYRFLSETWESPVIITTMVQLLNTMLGGTGSEIRRFHSLSESIIVIDEVQTVPLKMLSLFNLAVTFLSGVCGATVLLCSATQPVLESTPHPIRVQIHDALKDDPADWAVFKRTQIEDAGGLSIEEIPDFISRVLSDKKSLLVVCNTKAEAKSLYKNAEMEGVRKFHLSASMCMQHRKDTVEAIKESLADPSKKTLCISTQVIEAGVDISFESVIRLAAGLDSVIQSAGRCNRSGEIDAKAPVYIVRCKGENLGKLREIGWGKGATEDVVEDLKYSGTSFDIGSEQSIRAYYQKLYKEIGGLSYMDFRVPDLRTSIFSMLSFNKEFLPASQTKEPEYLLTQAFALAGKYFKVFDEETDQVIVPYKEGKEKLKDLLTCYKDDNPMQMKKLLRKTGMYTVSIYEYQKAKLTASGMLHEACDGMVLYVDEDAYDKELGLL